MNLEFELRFKELVSSGLHKLEATTKSIFDRIDRVTDGTNRHLQKLTEERKIHIDTSQLDHAHEKVKELSTAWEVMKGTMVGEFAFRGLERGVDMAKDFLKESVMGGMDEARVQMQMRVMAGDKGGAERYEAIHQNLLSGMYGPELYELGKSLTALGLGEEEMMKRMREFEDIAGGDRGNLMQLLQSYMEFKGTNNVANIAMLRPLAGMGFVPSKVLADHYHISQEKAKDLLETQGKGIKYYEQALDLITGPGGRMYNMQGRIMETPTGKYLQAVTNWENTKHEYGEKLLPVMGRLLDKLGPIMDRLPEKLDKLVPVIESLGDKFLKLIDWVMNNTDTIKSLIGTTKTLIEVYLVMKGAELLKGTGAAFMQGLLGTGAGSVMAGAEGGLLASLTGRGAMAWAGTGAGALEGIVGSGVWGVLGTVGGLAGLAFLVYEVMKNHDRPVEQAKQAALNKYTEAALEGKGTEHLEKLRMKAEQIVKYDSLQRESEDVIGGKAAAATYRGNVLRDVKKFYADRFQKLNEEETKMKQKEMQGDKTANSGGATDVSDAITAGGQKNFTINMNAPMYKVEHQVFQSIRDAIEDFEPKVQEAIWRIWRTLPAAQ